MAKRVWDESALLRSIGVAPVGGLGSGDEKLKQLQTLFTDFDCSNDQNLKISQVGSGLRLKAKA